MREIKLRLKESGLDVDLLAASPAVARLTQVSRAIHVCKDAKGAIGLVSVPETLWRFDGTIYLGDGLMLLIDKKVASECGL